MRLFTFLHFLLTLVTATATTLPIYTFQCPLSLPTYITALESYKSDLTHRISEQTRIYDACLDTKHDLMLAYVSASPEHTAAAREVWEDFSCWDVSLPLVDLEREVNEVEEEIEELCGDLEE